MNHAPRNPRSLVLIGAIVALSLITGYIHLTLASTTSLLGLLFLANAAGFATLAGALLAVSLVRRPLFQRFAWLPRLGLAGLTAMTIAGYLVLGPYFLLGWLTKAVELAILILLLVDVTRTYGSPLAFVRAALSSLRRSSAAAGGRV